MIRSSSWGFAFLGIMIFTSHALASAPVAQGWQPNKSNPYRGLFQPAPLVKPTEPTVVTPPVTPAKPEVVCGTTVITADPSIDPKFRFMIPGPDRPTKFTIRAIDPAICKPGAR
jgi:hypothetical protein